MSKAKNANKSYCDIKGYLEVHDPDFRQVIEDTCMFGTLYPKGPGIVLIRPTAKQTSQLMSLARGDPNAKQEARKIVRAHLLYMKLKTVDDFTANADDIPNALGKKVEVDAAKSGNGVIAFKHGAEAAFDKEFIDGSQQGNLCVMHLQSGTMPTEGEDTKKIKKKPTRIRRKKPASKSGEGYSGGGDGGMEVEQNKPASVDEKTLRNSLFDVICQNAREANMSSTRYDMLSKVLPLSSLTKNKDSFGKVTGAGGMSQSVINNPNYLTSAALCFLDYALNNGHKNLVKKIAPIISYEVCDILFIIEPCRNARPDQYLVPSKVLIGWVESLKGQGMTHSRTIAELITEVDSLSESALGGNGSDKFDTIMGKVGDNDIDFNGLKKVYEELLPILPQDLQNYYQDMPKMLHDEIRYRSYLAISKGRNIQNIIEDMKIYYTTLWGGSYEANINILRGGSLRLLEAFASSTFMFYINYPQKGVEDIKAKYETSKRPNDFDALFIPPNLKDNVPSQRGKGHEDEASDQE